MTSYSSSSAGVECVVAHTLSVLWDRLLPAQIGHLGKMSSEFVQLTVARNEVNEIGLYCTARGLTWLLDYLEPGASEPVLDALTYGIDLSPACLPHWDRLVITPAVCAGGVPSLRALLNSLASA